MSWTLMIPAALVLATWLAFQSRPLRRSPGVDASLTALILASLAATTMLVVTALGLGFLLESPPVASFFGWCSLLPSHRDVGWLVGVPSMALSGLMFGRLWAAIKRCRAGVRQGHEVCGRCRIEHGDIRVAEAAQPFAYAVPGRAGGIVVSTAMLAALTDSERRVMFAHERAHLNQCHHRHRMIAEISVAVVPMLKPLAKRLSLATERAADERAVESVLGDRRLVARAIAKAALVSDGGSPTVMAMSGGSVTSRVDAMLEERGAQNAAKFAVMAAAALVVVAWSGSVVQLHHMVGLLDHICG